MSGGQSSKGRVGTRKNKEPETRKDGDMSDVCASEDGDGMEDSPATLNSIRKMVSEVVAEGMRDLKSEMKKELSQVRLSFREDMKVQLDELRSEINQQIKAATGQVEEVAKRLGEVERSVAGREPWDTGVKDALIQLLNNQKSLQAKVADLEGRSRRNNIRIYGIPEKAEGTSMLRYVENMIQSELGDTTGLRQGQSLGIERAHRALASQPPDGAPPRSTVVRFLQFTVKEKILQAAWKKSIYVQESRVFFDHDYAEAVQQRRKEYTPIKRVLKENGIRFQTPLTRMRVHFDSGTVTFNSAEEAAADQRKRGLSVGPIPRRRSKDITVDSINNLMPWSTVGPRRTGDAQDYQESIRERLKGFQRQDREDAVMDE